MQSRTWRSSYARQSQSGTKEDPDRTIRQVKMQRKHHGPDMTIWELEDSMRLAHPSFRSILQSTEGGASVAF